MTKREEARSIYDAEMQRRRGFILKQDEVESYRRGWSDAIRAAVDEIVNLPAGEVAGAEYAIEAIRKLDEEGTSPGQDTKENP